MKLNVNDIKLEDTAAVKALWRIVRILASRKVRWGFDAEDLTSAVMVRIIERIRKRQRFKIAFLMIEEMRSSAYRPDWWTPRSSYYVAKAEGRLGKDRPAPTNNEPSSDGQAILNSLVYHREVVEFLSRIELTKRERFILRSMYGRGLSQTDTANMLRLTEPRICQEHKRLLAKLKTALAKMGVE